MIQIGVFPCAPPQAEQAAVRDAGDDGPLTKQLVLKPLDRQLAEHKDVTKAVIQLGSIVSSLRTEAEDVLQEFHHFSTLWNQVCWAGNVSDT